MKNRPSSQANDELPGDVQWTIWTVADLQLEAKALREDAQRSLDDFVLQLARRVSDHTLALQAILQELQAHVGPPHRRLPVWEQPTTVLPPYVPIDNDGD